MSTDIDPLTGKPLTVFIRYAVPSLLGMLALSSASIVNAMFLGNFVGPAALAAVNLTMPATALLYALAFMMAVGGSVNTGRFLGEGNANAASDNYSKTLLVSTAISLLIAIPSLVFLDQLVALLGANEELRPLVTEYLQVVFLAAPLAVLSFVLYYFVIVDGHPILGSCALLVSAAINVVMNWLLVVELEWGVFGAAVATSIANASILVVLLPHILSARAKLRIQIPRGSWRPVGRSMVNGFSEFTNELSVGVVTLMFNWILITRFGTSGVAAFTIVEYILFLGVMLSYGFTDALQPLVSKNYGAKQPERIRQYLKICMICTVTIGFGFSTLMLVAPQFLVSAFINEDGGETMQIAMQFIYYFWPASLFIGANITLTSYFTAMDRPLPSGIIALSRSLVLPSLFLMMLPDLLGDTGIFVTVPIAELISLIIAIVLFYKYPLRKMIQQPQAELP